MWVHGLHPLTHTLVAFVLPLFSLTKMATSTPTAIPRVFDDSMAPENQERAEQRRLSERDELLADAFASLTPGVRVPDVRAPQKRDERDCLGVYLCTKEDWRGDCYWACFRKGVEVQLEAEWAPNIKSVRPDHGAKCKFFFGPECRTRHKSQDMVYPGGDFDAKRMGKLGVGCFYCL
ncbi:hypothetical protein LX32DRAFT_635434 [Colletotrichum zoysiae]|uniref:Uncharacterized protein n=1 Tax=Colletotrichum zoysiae TaxID=1216348 RepID=A0AAD9HRP7_9PEZI|nr:hypothetical protein LX32DRAFT_635434 [Colletotrichum zoysiae]